MQVRVQDNFFSFILFAAICIYPKSAGYSTSFCQQQVTGRYECLGWRTQGGLFQSVPEGSENFRWKASEFKSGKFDWNSSSS